MMTTPENGAAMPVEPYPDDPAALAEQMTAATTSLRAQLASTMPGTPPQADGV
ncbi:MAG: hypothetical protein QOE99_754 [Actinomycetota bacterium]|jgi:hypothetical protein|nr:hypothetical protein [Actinomycetota bacterium]